MVSCSLEGAAFLQAQSSSLIPRYLPRMKEDTSTQRPPWSVYNSFIYNCQKSETTQTCLSSGERMRQRCTPQE